MNPYPTRRVMLGFTLCGGMLGSSLFLCFSSIYRIIHSMDVHIDLAVLLSISLMGIVFGTPPAFFTGRRLALQRIPRHNKGLLHAMLAGAVYATVTALIISLAFSLIKLFPLTAPLAALLGACSALILSLIFLPQPQKDSA